MSVIQPDKVGQDYDLVVAGTGFGAMFFVHRFIQHRPKARVLMVEWGAFRTHEWQVENRRNTDFKPSDTFVEQPGEKPWNFTIGFGGGTNCWWALTPRWMPNDFQLKTKYGVGRDWPFGYDEVEPYYLQAEQIMQIAGENAMGVRYPRSGPFPQKPHNLSAVDKLMKAAMPDDHFAVPRAVLREPKGDRGACCATFQCDRCPVKAKFTALNTFQDVYENPNVDILCDSRVLAVETAAGKATGLRYVNQGKEHVVKGDLVAVAANGIHTPFILMRSGIKHPVLGKFLHEKRIAQAEVFLDGLNNFDGGSPTSGINVSLIDGDHRKEAGAALIYFENGATFGLRSEYGRWRQVLPLTIFVETLPQEENGVYDEGGDLPTVRHPTRIDYSANGVERAIAKLPELLKPLPVEKIVRRDDLPTGSHVQGTVRMGADPADSVLDPNLVHHHIRNLLVLGTAVFPSCGTANPSLTASALSLRAADRIGA